MPRATPPTLGASCRRFRASGELQIPRLRPKRGCAWDDNRMGRAGLQASVNAAKTNASALPKASAEPTAERHKETAGPSARAEALGQNDKLLEDAGCGAESRRSGMTIHKESQQPGHYRCRPLSSVAQTFSSMPNRNAVVSPNSSQPFSASRAPISCQCAARSMLVCP
jgi:hypothetical protein